MNGNSDKLWMHPCQTIAFVSTTKRSKTHVIEACVRLYDVRVCVCVFSAHCSMYIIVFWPGTQHVTMMGTTTTLTGTMQPRSFLNGIRRAVEFTTQFAVRSPQPAVGTIYLLQIKTTQKWSGFQVKLLLLSCELWDGMWAVSAVCVCVRQMSDWVSARCFIIERTFSNDNFIQNFYHFDAPNTENIY